MATAMLYGLIQSPFTERALWALEHHGLAFTYHEHMPMVGEVLLRRKAGVKKATVPLLVDGQVVVMGSSAIAKHADAIGSGASLYPAAHADVIERWSETADRMAHVGRAWVMCRLLDSRAAQAESMHFLPTALARIFAPAAGTAIRFLIRKHEVPRNVEDEVTSTLRPALLEMRGAVTGRPHVLDSFSFADVALASQMHAIRPHADAKIGPATREAWTNEALALEFADLLEWRDAIYAKHRRRTPAPA